jgi:acyl-CoA dehydrogenase
MVENAQGLDFTPSIERADASITRKTIVANAVIDTVTKAIEAVGGAAYYRKLGLERLLRDAHAGKFHPLPERKQQEFTGLLAMGLPPATEMHWVQPLAQAAE